MIFFVLNLLLFINILVLIMLQNPIQFIMFLILMFMYGSGLLLVLEQEFFAFLFIIVYVGAVAILFLFVIMMLNIKAIDFSENIYKYFHFGIFVGIILFVIMNILIDLNLNQLKYSLLHWINIILNFNMLNVIGHLIYTYFFFYTIIAGIILFITLICCIELTLDKYWIDLKNKKKINIWNQLIFTKWKYNIKVIKKKNNKIQIHV